MADTSSLPTLPLAMDHESSDYSYISDSSGISDLSSPPDSPQPPSECYPTPPPTQDDQEERARATSSQDEPAKKKRRVGPPTPRSTQHLDLTNPERLPYADQLPQIKLLTKTLREHRKIIVIAGAGISTSAGSKSIYQSIFYLVYHLGGSPLTLNSPRLPLSRWSLQISPKETQPESIGQAAIRCRCLPR